VKNNGCALAYVLERLKTVKLCLVAVWENGRVLFEILLVSMGWRENEDSFKALDSHKKAIRRENLIFMQVYIIIKVYKSN
jgi:hypothetical protein